MEYPYALFGVWFTAVLICIHNVFMFYKLKNQKIDIQHKIDMNRYIVLRNERLIQDAETKGIRVLKLSEVEE